MQKTLTHFVRCPNPHPVVKPDNRWLLQPLVALALELARQHPDKLLSLSVLGGPPTIVTEIPMPYIVGALNTVREAGHLPSSGARFRWTTEVVAGPWVDLP